mgnify:CR=1 FL=1
MKLVDPETAVLVIGQDAVAVNERAIANIFEIQHSDFLRLRVRGAGQHGGFHGDRCREDTTAVEKIQAPRCAFENALISDERNVKRDSCGMRAISSRYINFPRIRNKRFAKRLLPKNRLVSSTLPQLLARGILLADLGADKEAHVFVIR